MQLLSRLLLQLVGAQGLLGHAIYHGHRRPQNILHAPHGLRTSLDELSGLSNRLVPAIDSLRPGFACSASKAIDRQHWQLYVSCIERAGAYAKPGGPV